MEMSFILGCLTSRLYPGQPLPQPPVGVDWSRVYRLLVDHGLAGVFCVLGREHPGLWPREMQERLLDWRYTMLLRGDRCVAQVHDVFSAFRQAHLPAIVLKGWTLIPTLYAGDYGQRFYEDIDLVVASQDYERATAILYDMGYRGTVREPWPGYMQRYGSTQAYVHLDEPLKIGRSFGIGLHLGLLSITYFDRRISAQDLFARSNPLEVAGVEARRLGPEDDLVYSCGHLALHHAYDESLHRYYEMASIILSAGEKLDWDELALRATQWRLIIPTQHILLRLNELWPGLVPGHKLQAITRLRPKVTERYAHDWSVAYRENHTIRALLDWLALPGLWKRGRFLLETAFPSPEYMRQRYGPAPLGWWPLLYLRRGQAVVRHVFHLS